MPKVKSVSLNSDAVLGLWEIREELPELLILAQQEGMHSIIDKLNKEVRSDSRKLEVLATRLLLKQMRGDLESTIEYDQWGKPYLTDESSKISISHCRSHAAIITHPELEAGIDIEHISPRILAIARRFMNDAEWAYLPNETDLEYLHLIWAAKECVYKIHGRHGVNFKNDIYVQQFNPNSEGELRVTFKKNTLICDYHLHYQSDGDKVLVYGWQEEEACRPIE